MLKFTSVRSSEPQVRNPTGLKRQQPNSGFHKTITNLLEPIPLPFPSYQLLKETSGGILSKYPFYVWKRPAHLRAHWLVVSDLGPAVLIDPRNTSNMFTLKFPFEARRVQHAGPIVCECAYDTQESTLYVWDVIVWEKEDIWTTKPYSERWGILQKIVSQIFDANHPTSEIRIKLPMWESLSTLHGTTVEQQYALEFQPEKAGQRRFLWLPPKKQDTFKPQTHHERAMVAQVAFVEDPDPPVEQQKHQQQPQQQTQKTHTSGILAKDTRSKLPDSYILTDVNGNPLGLPAIRRLDLSKQLRTYFTKEDSCTVSIQWYEPFQKYEIKHILETAKPV